MAIKHPARPSDRGIDCSGRLVSSDRTIFFTCSNPADGGILSLFYDVFIYNQTLYEDRVEGPQDVNK